MEDTTRIGQNPSDALRAAAQAVAKNGKGSTSQNYAQGLQQAANQLQGNSQLDHNDVASPPYFNVRCRRAATFATSNCRRPNLKPTQPSCRPQQSQQAAAQPAGTQNLMSKAIPAAMQFMRAKQSGASTPAAAIQAAMGAMSSSNPMQAGSSRGASNGLIAQGVMQALMSSLG